MDEEKSNKGREWGEEHVRFARMEGRKGMKETTPRQTGGGDIDARRKEGERREGKGREGGGGGERVLTVSPFFQHTVGAGSPVISTSRRSLFPATTMIVFLLPEPLVSRWILGGSVGVDTDRGAEVSPAGWLAPR